MATPAAKAFVEESIKKKNWSGPVIDLGTGIAAGYYRDLFAGHKYVTLDLRQDLKHHVDIIADIVDMPKVSSNSYGVVLLLETLEHVKNPFTAFSESARILKPGGLFICTTVASWPQHNHPVDYWRFLMPGLELLCIQSNLKIFHQEQTIRATQIPCQVMVATVKK